MVAKIKNPRPTLVIEYTGGKNLGRCYNSASYKITSTYVLDEKTLKALFYAGVIGYGQEFHIHSKVGRASEIAGIDVKEWVDDVTGEPAINPYTKNLYAPSEQPYYVYNVESRVDSSD